MINAAKCLVGTIACLLVSVTAVESQQLISGGWRDLLESRVRPAYRYTHAAAGAECPLAAVPMQAYLVTPGHDRPIGRTWLPGPNHSGWAALRGPSRPDTMAVRLVHLECAAQGRSILVEADGYYLEVSADQLASIDRDGEVTPGILLMDGSGGIPVPAAFEERCAVGGCVYALTDAEASARQVRTQLIARQEAQRREWAEAELSLELLRTGRRQASLGAQVRAESLARSNLLETLQRYGATDAQARAILERRVLVGMTPAMVRAALGDPEQTTQEITPQGVSTIWTYPGRRISFSSGLVAEVR